jgi:predicted GH43/DUF377 family glycosyl hydrolase
MKILAISCLAVTISACTWVTLSNEGQRVTIASNEDVRHCSKVGRVTAKTRATLLLNAKRNTKKMAAELSVLARNEASKISANTIVAVQAPNSNGEQQFNAYDCP